ncbi:plant invertase/pectin methylesterase inhibitor superfamily protein [Tanacetum coccineum]
MLNSQYIPVSMVDEPDVSIGSTSIGVTMAFLAAGFLAGFQAFLPPPGPLALAFSCCFRLSSSSLASLLSSAEGKGFMAKSMTFRNTAGLEGEQAVALRIQSEG